MKRREDINVPEFQSLEEEREYWEAHGPLTNGHKGRINKPKPGGKRSSFLAVRLTGEELTRLRDIAAKQGLGPSTFARLVLTSVIEREAKLPERITLDELMNMMLVERLPLSTKERVMDIARKISISDPNNPNLLIIDGSNKKELEGFALLLLSALLEAAGTKIITPKDERYEEVRNIVKAQT